MIEVEKRWVRSALFLALPSRAKSMDPEANLIEASLRLRPEDRIEQIAPSGVSLHEIVSAIFHARLQRVSSLFFPGDGALGIWKSLEARLGLVAPQELRPLSYKSGLPRPREWSLARCLPAC